LSRVEFEREGGGAFGVLHYVLVYIIQATPYSNLLKVAKKSINILNLRLIVCRTFKKSEDWNEMTDPTSEGGLTPSEERRIHLMQEATYRAIKRIDAEKKAEEEATPTAEIQVQAPRPEAEILYRHKLHWIVLLNALSFTTVFVAATIFFVGTWFLQQHLSAHIEETSFSRLSGLVPYVFPLLPAVLTVVFIVYRIVLYGREDLRNLILWFSETWTIDTYEVRHRIDVKGVFLNLVADIEDVDVRISRTSVIDPSVSQSWLGELLGYANLSLGNASEHDSRFKNIYYIPYPKKVKEILGL